MAHVGHGGGGDGGFLDGFLHPVTGLDHLMAMVGVGLWGAQLGAPAIWLLPVAFPLIMAIGGFVGVIGLPLPAVDTGVALSGLVLGAFIGTAKRTPPWLALGVVAVFALLHGHAHGTAMPLAGSPVEFGAGFVAATGLLHACGICIGLIVRWPAGRVAVRCMGVAIAIAAGISFAGSAFAHELSTRYGPLAGPAVHVLTEVDHAAAFVAIGLLAGQQTARRGAVVLAAFGFALLLLVRAPLFTSAFARFTGTEEAASATVLLVTGLLVMAGMRFPGWLLAVAGALVGAIHGLALGLGLVKSGGLAVIGAAGAAIVLAAAGAGLAYVMDGARGRVVVRVLGSWSAALGLILLGLALRA